MAHRQRSASLTLCFHLLAQSGLVPEEANSERTTVSGPGIPHTRIIYLPERF
jgi:hypothetical protein